MERGISLAVEDYAAARQLTGRLLAAGHRGLAFISGPPDHLAASAGRKGFAAAVAACPDARARFAKGGFYLASGEREALQLLSHAVRPTALFAANDSMAAGALKAAAELGLSVPGDLAVAGFDDSALAELTAPPLTSVRQPTECMARRATAMLIEAASSSAPAAESLTRFACTLVERGSSVSAAGRNREGQQQGDTHP